MDSDAVAGVIAAIHRPTFPASLHRMLATLARFDWMTILLFPPRRRPVISYSSSVGPSRRVIFGPYLAGGYAIDPFYAGIRERALPGMASLEMAIRAQGGLPPGYRQILVSADVADEVCFLNDRTPSGLAMVSVVRSGAHSRYSERDINALRDGERIVQAALDRHFEGVRLPHTHPAEPTESMDGTELVRHVLQASASTRLTDRECEVVQMIIAGYTSFAIGERLGISAGTVKIHRKNAYRKLAVSSQAELFSTFYASVRADPAARI